VGGGPRVGNLGTRKNAEWVVEDSSQDEMGKNLNNLEPSRERDHRSETLVRRKDRSSRREGKKVLNLMDKTI